jgi:TolB-like protein
VEGERVKRRLAAILAADVAGYSRLTGADEEGTISRLKALRRELIDPTIDTHVGRIVKTTGDGILIEFASVVDAVRCAVEVQRGMASGNRDVAQDKHIEFRVGIHIGDVVVEGDDLLGDGVNVAARLEGIAEPGGICVSEDAYRHARDKVDATFCDIGEQQLKNIARPMRAYRVVVSDDHRSKVASPLSLPDKPSIAVLPFQNMSGDPEQEYFADGVVEEIITALSRFRHLFVIARNSSFTYKGRSVDVKQVGRELGVRYVLEGSVRKAANKVRITGQLIDSSTGAHLWADRFDGSLEDIFDLQDQVTASVVGAIAPKLQQAEIERAKRKPTESLDAYDYYLRGMANLYRWTNEGISEALRLFYQAIERDPEFASAYGAAAWCYYWRMANGWTTDRAQDVSEVDRLAGKAAEFGNDDAVALSFGALALGLVAGDLEAAIMLVDRALVLNPSLAAAWFASGCLRNYFGAPDVGIDHLARAMRLSPLDPLMSFMLSFTAMAHFLAGRYGEAWPLAERVCRERPNSLGVLRMAAACDVLAGRMNEASGLIARALQLDPDQRISNLKDRVGPYRPEDFAKYADALRKAGLPE